MKLLAHVIIDSSLIHYGQPGGVGWICSFSFTDKGPGRGVDKGLVIRGGHHDVGFAGHGKSSRGPLRPSRKIAACVRLCEKRCCPVHMIPPRRLDDATAGAWAVSALLISTVAGGGVVAGRLAGLGAKVQVVPELCDAFGALGQGTHKAALLVIDCDHAGGLDRGRFAFESLAKTPLRLPVILISSDCAEQIFPVDQDAPYHLRAPLSLVALRIAFELVFAVTPACPAHDKGRSLNGAPFPT